MKCMMLNCTVVFIHTNHSQHCESSVEPTSIVHMPLGHFLMVGSAADRPPGLAGLKAWVGLPPGPAGDEQGKREARRERGQCGQGEQGGYACLLCLARPTT